MGWAHRQWVRTIQWDHAAERAVVEDHLLALDQIERRLTELDARLAETAQTDPYREPVAWLRCFRGIDTLTAIAGGPGRRSAMYVNDDHEVRLLERTPHALSPI